MPTTYTPDPTATQAPASQPDPDDFPLETLPSSGDGATAASVAQAFKVCGDFIAWLKKPRAVPSAWAQAIRRYKDARLRDRFIIDQSGLPGGSFLGWDEDWTPATQWSITGVSGAQLGRWKAELSDAGAQLASITPGIAANLNFSDCHRTLAIDVDSSATAKKSAVRIADDSVTDLFTTNALFSMRYTIAANNVTNVDWVHGYTSFSEDVASIAHGAFFISVNGGNWHARTINGGGPTDTDTGISGAAGAVHEFKIVHVGGAIADDSVDHVIFMIDGVVKANHTATLPLTFRQYPIFGGFTTGASGLARMLLGPVHHRQITAQATP